MRTALLPVLLVLGVACGSSAVPSPKSAESSSVPSTEPAVLPPWSEQTFDANVQAKLAQRFPGAEVVKLDEDGYRVAELEMRFTKARHWCREDWSRCEEAVDHTLDALLETQNPGAGTRDQLRVLLRSSEKLAYGSASGNVLIQPFSSDAQWVLALDQPRTIRLSVDPAELGVSADEAWRIATENTKPTQLVTATANGFIVYQDDYAPSALRFPALMEAAAREALPGKTGNLLAVCPEENIVLYTIGGADEAATLRDVAMNGANNSVIPLSVHVMEWSNGSWREAR